MSLFSSPFLRKENLVWWFKYCICELSVTGKSRHCQEATTENQKTNDVAKKNSSTGSYAFLLFICASSKKYP